MGRDRKLLKAVLPALALPMALAACGGGSSQPAPVGGAPCPRIAILADGADLTRYREGAGRDLTAMVVDARVTGFEARCDFAGSDRGVLDVRIVPRFEAERGPAATARSVDLPWFVALSTADDSEVLARIAGTTRMATCCAGRACRTSPPTSTSVPPPAPPRASAWCSSATPRRRASC